MGPSRSAHSNRKIEPLFNDVFVRVFGRDDSRAITKSLVNAILRSVDLEEIDEIDSISAENTDVGGSIDVRSARYDVLLVAGERIFDLEAQCYPEDIADRSLFYGAKLLTSAIGKGDSFADMPCATVITLLDTFPLFADSPKIVHLCELAWDKDLETQVIATDKLRFVLVELSKIRARYNTLSDEVLSSEALAWFYLLTSGFNKEPAM